MSGSVTIDSVREKVRSGERLSAEDGLALFRHPDVVAVGQLANEVANGFTAIAPTSTATCASR